jgi:hypothetical protein
MAPGGTGLPWCDVVKYELGQLPRAVGYLVINSKGNLTSYA